MSPLDIIELPGQPGKYGLRILVEAWIEAGSPPVNSAGRLVPEQQRLYDGWAAGLPGFYPADNPADLWRPLAHVRFGALDIDPTPERVQRLAAAGLRRPYRYEPWHWELPDIYSYPLVYFIPTTTGGAKLPPLPEGKTMADVKQIHCTKDNTPGGAVHARALLIPGTAWALPFTEAAATTANAAGRQFETGDSEWYSRSMFDAFIRAAERCAPTALTIDVVDADS